MRRLTTLRILITGWLYLTCFLAVYAQSPTVNNIRLTVDERAGLVRILYDLSAIRPGDSVSVVLNGIKAGRILPRSVEGDVGRQVKVGSNRTITWDVVKDDINLDEDVRVTIQIVSVPVAISQMIDSPPKDRPFDKPTIQPKRSLVVPIIGLVAAAGLGGYSFSQYLANQKDVDAYDAIPYIDNKEDDATLAEIRQRVEDRNNKILIPAVAAGVILVADVAYVLLVKPKPRRTVFNLRLQSGAPAFGFRHTF